MASPLKGHGGDTILLNRLLNQSPLKGRGGDMMSSPYMQNTRLIGWVLRVAVAGEFLGHGVFALQGKVGWFKYFHAVGITGDETIKTTLFIVGLMDVALALLVLIKPIRIALLWMAVWGLWTAMIRWPVGPDPMWDFVERWANWGAPLALLLLIGWPKNVREWFNGARQEKTI